MIFLGPILVLIFTVLIVLAILGKYLGKIYARLSSNSPPRVLRIEVQLPLVLHAVHIFNLPLTPRKPGYSPGVHVILLHTPDEHVL
jgi:hypothetical protein